MVIVALLWSVPWAIGLFVSKTLANHIKSIGTVIGIEIATISILLVLLFFVLGVVFEVAEPAKIVWFITISFGMSLIINNDYK